MFQYSLLSYGSVLIIQTHSAAADDGCIKAIFWAADDQQGRESSFDLHHSSIWTNVRRFREVDPQFLL